MERDDAELIHDSLSHDTKAFKHLVDKYLKSIYNFAYRLTNNKEASEDITQETFIKVWKNLKNYDSSKSFKTWIISIARNSTIDYFRKRKSVVFSQLDENDTDESFEGNLKDVEALPDEIFANSELKTKLENALLQIPLNQRTVILLKYVDEYTFEEIAEIIGKSMNTVKSQYRRGLITLKKIILSAPK